MKLKYRVIERFHKQYSVKAMCEFFRVSRSGYYAWRKRQGREAGDQWLIDLIKACQSQSKQTYGIRRVRRWIQRHTGKLLNTKAILRVMRKLNLPAVIRRRRPYTRYQQAIHKYPNLLNRNFDQAAPNRFWATDITTETGAHILEGVAQGMTEAGWDTDAETVAANLESALNMAFDINSPSERVKPVGDNVAAGVGAGMSAHDFSTDASTVASATYIPIPGKMLYMCAVLDLCGKVVLAWEIGADMCSSLVTDITATTLEGILTVKGQGRR